MLEAPSYLVSRDLPLESPSAETSKRYRGAWEAYDPNGDRWLRVPKMTFNECFSCSDKESLAVGTELLLFGKEVMSHVIYKYSVLTHAWTSAEIYSLESGEWTVIPSMNKARKMCSWTGASMLLERETRRCLCVVRHNLVELDKFQ
ncbi:hypothetical protein F2Q70_00016064 [Brassica cretica]|uniref:Uncharacterized protein n=1 Tax=Brassica cretica TaxID=69181 RepID=A0A8S9I197_BRACR|nr:hypothetical protein F2Q70_00016064 [Brassica cretica]